MKVIARLEFELAYYDSAVHRFNHSYHEDSPFKFKTKKEYKIIIIRNIISHMGPMYIKTY